MKTGEDEWCSMCFNWMPIDKNGNCIKCHKHILVKPKIESWLERYGIDLKEISPTGNQW